MGDATDINARMFSTIGMKSDLQLVLKRDCGLGPLYFFRDCCSDHSLLTDNLSGTVVNYCQTCELRRAIACSGTV